MADKQGYAQAAAKVLAGTASPEDVRLNNQMARISGGGQPAQAREANAKSGEGKRSNSFW